MKNRFEECKQIIKDLENKGISMLELEIWNEIDCQLDKELTDNQLGILYCTVENAYLKAEDITIEQLVRYCIEHLDKIYDMNIWDIILEASMI